MGKMDKAAYARYEAGERSIKAYFNMLAATTAAQAQMLEAFGPMTLMPQVYKGAAQKLAASADVLAELGKPHPKPSFGLAETVVDGTPVKVTEEAVLKKDFCTVLHFKRDTKRNDPKVLIVAAMSGHHATQFKDTVAALLPHHDVYIVDWNNARDVPLAKGDFGFDDYVMQVKEALQAVGQNTHVIGVSQSTVPVLAAVSLLAAEKSADQPLSMTLMGGPVDVRAAKTAVTTFVKGKTVKWFADRFIAEVPKGYAGEGRAVYPGFLQLANLLAVNPAAHLLSYADLFNALSRGDKSKADDIKSFYDEYLAVSDLTEKFYLETLEKVFLKQELADGTMQVGGKKVSPQKIKDAALMTVEGERDNIVAAGQTAAAHALCSGIDAGRHYHLLQPDADHYGLFSGKVWREKIMPQVAHMIRASAAQRGLKHDAMSGAVAAQKWPETVKAPAKKPKCKAGKGRRPPKT